VRVSPSLHAARDAAPNRCRPCRAGRIARAKASGSEGLPDIRVDDLPGLLAAFYGAVGRDPLLAPYFAQIDLAAHLLRIADFWATLLFHAERYHGNAFRPHLGMPGLTPAHFATWLAALERTLDARHAGPVADRMKATAHRIAYSMQVRLDLRPCAPYVHTGTRAAP
jgi:hemoglobin